MAEEASQAVYRPALTLWLPRRDCYSPLSYMSSSAEPFALNSNDIHTDIDYYDYDKQTPLPVVRSRTPEGSTLLSATDWATAPFQSPFRQAAITQGANSETHGEMCEDYIPHSWRASEYKDEKSCGDDTSTDYNCFYITGCVSRRMQHSKTCAPLSSSTNLNNNTNIVTWPAHVIDFVSFLIKTFGFKRVFYVWKARISYMYTALHSLALLVATMRYFFKENRVTVQKYEHWKILIVGWVCALFLLEGLGAIITYRILYYCKSETFDKNHNNKAFISQQQREQLVINKNPTTGLIILSHTLTLATVIMTSFGFYLLFFYKEQQLASKEHPYWQMYFFDVDCLLIYSYGVLTIFLLLVVFHAAMFFLALCGLSFLLLSWVKNIKEGIFSHTKKQQQGIERKCSKILSSKEKRPAPPNIESRITTASSILQRREEIT